MDERIAEEGLGEAYWRAARRRASWGSIAGGLLVLTLLCGALAWSATVTAPSEAESLEPSRTVIGGEGGETTAGAEATASVEPTSPAATVSDGTADGNGASPIARAPVVAYRRDGWLCVRPEEGATETRVIESQSGRFALSPDGATIAWADDNEEVLKLVAVAGGKTVTVGPAYLGPPSWAPDSSWLVYSGPGPTVRRVNRDGTGDTQLFEAVMPVVASDGQTVVAATQTGEPSEILVWRAGALSRIAVSEAVSALASDGRTVYFGLGAPALGTASLHAIQADGSSDRVLVASPATSMASAFADLALSPDGAQLLYAEWGDDQYSRVFVLPTTGGTAQALSSRRDSYTLVWGATGDDLFLIEGNAYQGEPTGLVTVQPDGTDRRLVVGGATR